MRKSWRSFRFGVFWTGCGSDVRGGWGLFRFGVIFRFGGEICRACREYPTASSARVRGASINAERHGGPPAVVLSFCRGRHVAAGLGQHVSIVTCSVWRKTILPSTESM